jgi:hypothetical protein
MGGPHDTVEGGGGSTELGMTGSRGCSGGHCR